MSVEPNYSKKNYLSGPNLYMTKHIEEEGSGN